MKYIHDLPLQVLALVFDFDVGSPLLESLALVVVIHCLSPTVELQPSFLTFE